MNKRKMFLLISALVVLNTLTYSAPEDDAENTLNQIDKSIEQEKQRIEQEKRQKELENTKFNSTVPEEIAPVQDNGIKFLINTINIEDKDKLLSSGEKKKLIKKYKGTELSANDITALLTQGTNKLIAKGYITSVASLSNNNDLRTGVLNLVIVAGKIEDVKINEGKLNDKIKEYVLFSKNSGKVLNVRDLDNVTDSLYSRSANKFDMKIAAGTKNSYSNILLHNELKDRFVISFNGNNYNQSSTNDKQNNQAGIYKESIGIKLDSPLGLNDTLGVRFTTMLDERNPNRDWKVSPDEIPVGTVLPIGPVGYKAGDYLGYKRKLEMFDFSYEVPFRTYRLKFNSSKSLSDSSIYAYNTVYDIRSDNTTIKLDLEKILWRNQTSKLIFDVGYKYKHNIQLFETATLTNRKLAILNTDLTYTTAFLKGLLGTTLTYERGLRGLGAERDDNKSLAVPEAQFDKYSINVNYYKPVSKKVTFRTNISGMYSPDVLYGSERTTSGGIGSVGGYQRGQTIQGDRSIEVSSELSYKIPVFKKWGNLEPYINYGYATTKYNYDDSEYAIGHISGTTIGAKEIYEKLKVKRKITIGKAENDVLVVVSKEEYLKNAKEDGNDVIFVRLNKTDSDEDIVTKKLENSTKQGYEFTCDKNKPGCERNGKYYLMINSPYALDNNNCAVYVKNAVGIKNIGNLPSNVFDWSIDRNLKKAFTNGKITTSNKLIMYDYNKTGGVITIDNLQDKRYIDVLNELGEKNNGDYWW